MAMDLTSVLLGLAGAALPLLVLAWQLQRRASTTQADEKKTGSRFRRWHG